LKQVKKKKTETERKRWIREEKRRNCRVERPKIKTKKQQLRLSNGDACFRCGLE